MVAALSASPMPVIGARRSRHCSPMGRQASGTRWRVPPRAVSLCPDELLVRDPMRLVGIRTLAPLQVLDVRLVIPLVPDHLAVPLEGEDVRRDAIEEPAIVGDHDSTAGE